MWSSPQKFFSVTLASQKSGSLDSRPVTPASIQVDNHEKWNKYVIVPQKIFSVTLASQKVGLSTVAPCHSPLFKLIITKNVISMWSSLKNFFSWRSPLSKWVSTVAPWHSPLFKLIITKNVISMWSSPQKIFLRDARLSKVGLSTVAPWHSPLFKLIITKK